MSGNYRHEKNCLNCGHLVEEHYCSHCGQPNLELKEPFWGFIGHSVGHYFHFDSKFFSTLVPLLTKPGQLTLDYIAGKRARYIHPVSLYIFVSIVYFLIVPHMLVEKPEEKKQFSAKELDSVNRELKSNPYVPGIVSRKINAKLDSGSQFQKLSLPAQQHYVDSLKSAYKVHPTDALDNQIDIYDDIVSDRQDSTLSSYEARQAALPASERDSWWVQFIQKKGYDKDGNRKPDEGKAKTDKQKLDIKEELKIYQPKQFFLLMPLLALFIMWNFRKNKIYYIDHLVFTIHGMTAFFIVSIVTKPIQRYIFGLDSITSKIISVLVFAGVVWYLYSGLKLFYNRSSSLTIRKTITVIILYFAAYSISEQILRSIITHIIG